MDTVGIDSKFGKSPWVSPLRPLLYDFPIGSGRLHGMFVITYVLIRYAARRRQYRIPLFDSRESDGTDRGYS
jgi:hypothetical protein